jgi:hypothetical protein
MKIGKASYSAGGNRKEIFKIKDGDNVYRPLPPLGDLADSNRWSMYYRVCWGYKDKSGKNRPFLSPREVNFRTKMVDVDCAAFNRSMRLKDEYQNAVKEAKDQSKAGKPLTDAQKEQLENMKNKMMTYNIDSKHYINAMDLEGRIGLLKLGARAMTGLRGLGKKLESEGVDICGLQGRYVNINRSGTGLDTTYQVFEYKANVEVEIDGNKEIVQRSMPHKLDDSIIARLEKEAFELDKLYPAPTPQEVQEMVKAHEMLDRGEITEDQAAEIVGKVLEPYNTKNSNSEESSENTETREQSKVETASTKSEDSKVESSAASETVDKVTGEIKDEKSSKEELQSPTPSSAQSDDDFLANLKY